MKKRENFTIDEDLMKEFEEYVAKEQISKSATVENLIRNLLNSKKKKVELINKEHILKLSNLINELSDYKEKISSLFLALDDVLNDDVCSELLKDGGLYSTLNHIAINTSIEYDDLADDVNSVYETAIDLLNAKNKSIFLLKDYLSEELVQVDKDYITKNGIDYDKWVEENEKLGLDINKYKYLLNPNIMDSIYIYYFGEKVASKVMFNPTMAFDETFGIKIVAERERLYANDNNNLRFHPEFNQFALYYFLKDYKEIEIDNIYEIFECLYLSITEDGIDKIPSEVIDYVTQYNPYTTCEIVDKVNNCLNIDSKEDDIVTIYKYIDKDKINFKNDLGWFLNEESLEIDNIKEGLILKGEIKIKDILAVNDINYGYIFAKYNDVKNISIIKS